ncbi:hypothetical protein CsSME_00002624 [Camellia sinensis var. sinensis]
MTFVASVFPFLVAGWAPSTSLKCSAFLIDPLSSHTRSVFLLRFSEWRGGVLFLRPSPVATSFFFIWRFKASMSAAIFFINSSLTLFLLGRSNLALLGRKRALPVGPEEGGFGMSYDLLYGRAGFLWAALFINKYLGQETIPNDLLMPVVEAVWHGTRYWGAAHGLAGILHVLLHFPLSQEDANDVKQTLRYMMSNRFPHSGNYPSSEGNPRDKLVQWSHGATAMAITLCKASQVFVSDREFRDAAIEAGEVVWKSGLVKKVGLADGVAGNAYAFLSLYRLTGEAIYEERAKAFASFLYHNTKKLVSEGHSQGVADRDYSLFQGLAGTACLWLDLLAPENSKFPGYEL